MSRHEHQAGRPLTSGRLYRRIWPHTSYFSNGRVTSQVFDRKRDAHLSMDFAELTTPDTVAARAPAPGFGVFEIDIADLLAEGLEVIYDPSEMEGSAHVQVRGTLSGSVRKRLSAKAVVVIPPTLP